MSDTPEFVSKKLSKAEKAEKRNETKDAIIGLAMLIVVVSIAYSSYVVWFGTTGQVPKIMLAPQLLFAAAMLISKFKK